MERIELELAEKTLERARSLAERRHCSLDQLIADCVKRETTLATPSDSLHTACFWEFFQAHSFVR